MGKPVPWVRSKKRKERGGGEGVRDAAATVNDAGGYSDARFMLERLVASSLIRGRVLSIIILK